MAKSGEWDRIETIAPALIADLEIAGSSTDFNVNQSHRAQLTKVLRMLGSTIELCQTRKDQIAPLINAFASAVNIQTKP